MIGSLPAPLVVTLHCQFTTHLLVQRLDNTAHLFHGFESARQKFLLDQLDQASTKTYLLLRFVEDFQSASLLIEYAEKYLIQDHLAQPPLSAI